MPAAEIQRDADGGRETQQKCRVDPQRSPQHKLPVAKFWLRPPKRPDQETGEHKEQEYAVVRAVKPVEEFLVRGRQHGKPRRVKIDSQENGCGHARGMHEKYKQYSEAANAIER